MLILSTPTQAQGSNAGVPDISNLRPVSQAEFLTSAEVRRVFGITKSALYVLKDEGKIRSCAIRKRNAVRGKRLWMADSIREFLLANMDEATPSTK